MSDFFDKWEGCMSGKSFAVPNMEALGDALEFIQKVREAWENAGADEELQIATLIAAGAFAGVDEATLVVLGQVAEVAVTIYLTACITCLASAAYDDLVSLNEAGRLPDYVVATLHDQGTDLNSAVA